MACDLTPRPQDRTPLLPERGQTSRDSRRTMFRRVHALLALLALSLCLLASPALGFSVPQLFWPQHDIDSAQAGSPLAPCSILVASRASDYKRALAAARSAPEVYR